MQAARSALLLLCFYVARPATVTVDLVYTQIGDIFGNSFSRGQVIQNVDCPRKSGTSGHLK